MGVRALVLSGGGSKGAYECGALQHWMGDLGLDYSILCGTSVGAINCAYLAQVPLGVPTPAAVKLYSLWKQVTTAKIYKRWFPFGRLHALWKTSVYDSTPAQKWIRAGLNVDAVAASGRTLRIVSWSFDSGEVTVTDEKSPDLASWVIASSAFPVMFSPIEIDGELRTDGGVREVTPLGEAIRAGAEEIDMILCSDPFAASRFNSKKAHAIPQLTMRVIDGMNTRVARTDLQIAGLKNDLSELRPKYRQVKIRLLDPAKPLPYDSLDFSPANINAMIEQGRADAIALEGAGASLTAEVLEKTT